MSAPPQDAPVRSPAGTTDAAPAAPTTPAARYIDRELSWLDFNARVLDLAADASVPLLERVKFLAIFSNNLDEFFQVRVAGLKDQIDAGLTAPSPRGLTPAEQLAAVRRRTLDLTKRQSQVFLDEVVPALAAAGIRLSDWASLDDDDREHLVEVFERRIFPVLTPLAVDPGHPFPYISTLSLNLGLVVRDPVTRDRRFARVKVPALLPRFVVMPDGERFVPLEQVIAAHLDVLFPGMEVESSFTFRVTRHADFTLEEEEADDLLEAIESELRRRRFGRAVRLEIDPQVAEESLALLVDELEVAPADVYPLPAPLDLGGLWAVHDLDRPELKDETWMPTTQAALAATGDDPVDLFAVLRERDILVHHPYDSFATSVEAFLRAAADDPRVLAIKQTLYRTSGDSPVVKALISAAEQGKQVAVLVELKARFDEQRNIAWARALEEAGVHVVYGLVGLKTHSKTALVVRDEDDGIRRYVHIGTGNYNPKTARMYEDIGLLSARPELGADLTDLFNHLTGYSRATAYRRLVLAPSQLRDRIIELIRAEAELGSAGRIIMKMNALSDPAIIDALYEASGAGVRTNLIVRGICCLRPGVQGLSDNIRVRSIVGRYLEHSRIYYFGAGGAPRAGSSGRGHHLIGSADMMGRNLDRRIEVVVPVEDPDLQDRLREVLQIGLADDTWAWELGPDACWSRVDCRTGVEAQRRLYELATERARRRRPATSPLGG